MTPSVTRKLVTSNSTANDSSTSCVHPNVDTEQRLGQATQDDFKTYSTQNVPSLYPDVNIMNENTHQRRLSPTPLISQVTTSAHPRQGAKSSGALTKSLRSIKHKNRTSVLTHKNNGVNAEQGKQAIASLVPDGSIATRTEENDPVALSSSPIHRPSLTTAIVSPSLSDDAKSPSPPIPQPPTSKIKAVIQTLQQHVSTSKVLMVLVLCILCLPGNVVTINLWIKYTILKANSPR